MRSDEIENWISQEDRANSVVANASVSMAMETNPDELTRHKRIASLIGAPVAAVQAMPEFSERAAKMREIQEAMNQSPSLRKAFENPEFAKIAHDDAPNLSNIMRTLSGTMGDIGVTALKGAMGLPSAGVGLLDIPTFGYAGKGLSALGLDFDKASKLADQWYSPAQQQANEAVRKAKGFLPTLEAAVRNPSTIATAVGESLPAMLGGAGIARGVLGLGAKGLSAGLAGPVLPGVLTRAVGKPAAQLIAAGVGEGTIGAGMAAEQIRNAMPDKTLTASGVASAIASGVGTGLIGVLGGKVAQKLGIDDIDVALASGTLSQDAVKKGLLRRLAEGGLTEGVLEELPQSAQEQVWQNIATDKPIMDGVAEAAAMGLLAGAVSGSAFQGVAHLASRNDAKAKKADQGFQQFAQLHELASVTKTLQRDSSSFESLITDAANDGPVQDVFIDGKTLMQTGIAEKLAEISPSVAEQLPLAAETGGYVRIPTAEYLAKIAPTQYAQSLLDHVKFDPDEYSRSEADSYMQTSGEQMRQEVEKVLAGQEDQATFQADTDAVKTAIKDQLAATQRFRPDVNDAYSALASSWYAVTAAKLGKTPGQLWKEKPLRVVSTLSNGGMVLGQGVALQQLRDRAKAADEQLKKTEATPDVDADQYWAQINEAVAAEKAFADELSTIPDDVFSLEAKTPDGRMLAINPSAQKPGHYQVTRFDKAGQPWGDTQYPTKAAAIKEFVSEADVSTVKDFSGVLNQSAYTAPTITVDGVERPTTNSKGQPIARTEEWLRNFWRWFKDSAVTDADGRPMVVYHGSSAKFETFDIDKLNSRNEGPGFYFTTNEDVARGYVNQEGSAGQMVQAYLSLRKPMSYSAKPLKSATLQKMVTRIAEIEAESEGNDIRDGFLANFGDTYSNGITGAARDAAKLIAQDETAVDQISGIVGSGVSAEYVLRAVTEVTGYDGIVSSGFSNVGDASNTIYVAFDPTKIKSINNRGTFDPADANILYQAAFHGSPYRFSKFSLDHLGKGEGAQAFGYGLYFAGSEDVAEYYRQKLSGDPVESFELTEHSIAGDRNWIVVDNNGKRSEFLTDDELTEYVGRSIAKRAISAANEEPGAGDSVYELPEPQQGQLYRVEIPEEGNYLLWDKPLSEQSNPIIRDLAPATISDKKKKRAELKEMLRRERDAYQGDADEFEGSDDYRIKRAIEAETDGALDGKGLYSLVSSLLGSDEAASKYLNSLGIAGIKYLDGSSRAAGDGQFNFVIFDDAAVQILETYYQEKADIKRGAFHPPTNTITLLKDANLSTFLHELGHFFLEAQFDFSGHLDLKENRTAAEDQMMADSETLLKWFGMRDLNDWYSLDFEEKRGYHEQFARGFEAYLFEGKAPSIELQGLFGRFRAWLLDAYRHLIRGQRQGQKSMDPTDANIGAALNVQLSDEVRAVMDRMIATEEQIQQAQEARSMMPLFLNPEKSGMTPEEWAKYQGTADEATAKAIAELQAKGLRDLQWSRNKQAREIKRLQRESREARQEVMIEARREVMSQPVYQAWAFLTRKITPENKLYPLEKPKSTPKQVDETVDSLFVAIAKLGGLDRAEVETKWGIDPKEQIKQQGFGLPGVLRKSGGKSIDEIGMLLSQWGYFPLDQNERFNTRDFENAFNEELSGSPYYSLNADYSVLQNFRPGEQVVNPGGLDAGRLDVASLISMSIPEAEIARLTGHRMTAKEGIHPDVLVEAKAQWGYDSGSALVDALLAADPPRDAIEKLTDQYMLERHGELASEEAIAKAADAAIFNDVRGRMIETEANALAKAAGTPKLMREAVKQFAASMIDRLKIRNIKPSQYANAAARSAKAAEAASKAGNTAQAAIEKRNQTINHYATKTAQNASEEVDSGVRYLKKFESDGVRQKLDQEYLDQIDALLERYDLRKQSDTASDKRKSMRDWVDEQLSLGNIPAISDRLLSPKERAAYLERVQSRNEEGDLIHDTDEKAISLLAAAIDASAKTPYRELSLEEFRGVVDSIKAIEHLGRMKKAYMTAKDNATFDAVVDECVAGIIGEAKNEGMNEKTRNDWLGKFKQGLERFGAAHVKVATWARIMDGGKDNGPIWRRFVAPANERSSRTTTMRAEATTHLYSIMAPILKKVSAWDKIGKGKVAAVGESLNWQERFAIVLNMGNESNMQRLLDGKGWGIDQVMQVAGTLSAEELRAAQAVWDHFETYRPQIAEMEMKLHGKAPEWIPARRITIRSSDGVEVELRGGYFPVVFDPNVNLKSSQHEATAEADMLRQSAKSSAKPRQTFVKERVAEVKGRPLLLNLQALYTGTNDVIHYLNWADWAFDVNRLLRNKQIDEAIREHYGPQVKAEFESWRTDIIAGTRRLDSKIEHVIAVVRRHVSVAGLAFNVLSAAMQPLGLANSVPRIGAHWVGVGVKKFSSAPILSTREAMDKSEWLRNRGRTRFRELNELRNQVQGQTKAEEWMRQYSFWLMVKMQMTVDIPTWWGAYEKAIAGGNGTVDDDSLAVALADQAVKDSQGGGEEVDQAGVERGPALAKLFTVYYGFMATTANTIYLDAKTEKQKAKRAAKFLLVTLTPAILGMMLKDALIPGDADDDDLAKKLALEELSFLLGMVVLGRELVTPLKQLFGEAKGQSYSGPAGLRMFADASKLAQQAGQGEFDDAFRKAFISFTGDAIGIPAVQANRTITGAMAIKEGKVTNPVAIMAAPIFGYQEKK